MTSILARRAEKGERYRPLDHPYIDEVREERQQTEDEIRHANKVKAGKARAATLTREDFQRFGSIGGKKKVQMYGREHMAEIGAIGGEARQLVGPPLDYVAMGQKSAEVQRQKAQADPEHFHRRQVKGWVTRRANMAWRGE